MLNQKNQIKMPAPSILPLLIAGGASLVGSVTGALSSRGMQRKQMEHDEKFWHMQNEYNSPQKQMERLQTAGLNPNLVYGQSSGGATGQAERLKTPDVDSSAHRWIDPQGTTQVLSQYADWNVKQAQTDNLQAQTQVAQENAILTAQKSYGEGIRNARTKLDLHLAEDTYHSSMEHAREQVRKLRADTQYTLNQDERASIMNSVSVQEAVERILTQRLGRSLTSAQIANLRADNELKELDKRLAQMGVRPTDPFYATAIARFLLKYSEARKKLSE